MRQYVLTNRTFGQLRVIEHLVCYTCGKALKLGQEVVRTNGKHNLAVVRHKECFESIAESGRDYA